MRLEDRSLAAQREPGEDDRRERPQRGIDRRRNQDAHALGGEDVASVEKYPTATPWPKRRSLRRASTACSNAPSARAAIATPVRVASSPTSSAPSKPMIRTRIVWVMANGVTSRA